MSQGLVNACNDVKWQYFVTLTFGASFTQKKTPNKIHRVYSWLRTVQAHHNKTSSLEHFRFLLREEHGEQGGRFHYHILMADLSPASPGHCHAMSWVWREKMKVGYAVIRPYTRSLNGVDYVLKGLSPKYLRPLRETENDRDKRHKIAQNGTCSGRFNSNEANNYELGKYAMENTQTESDAALPSRALTLWLEGRVSRKAKAKARFQRSGYRYS
jgi:hypothetical protein